ncbi:unnamed protein product [Caenorhabditis angaria]|uniref:TRAPPC10/Trs130 N-terminal domain-containing protein n=1 Tax=Caenorhabditis angaria TaxID=860376 RepID=A0A9P1I415_9PELO|nr:unnamed protein product [Caenorhabditis angaria]
MERMNLDINALSRSFKKTSVLISCSGADSNFSVYQHALTSYFSRTPIVWKRNNKVFPHLLTFPLKFVPYEDKLCFGPHITPLEICNIAYLHVYHINVLNADDYRSNVRHNVSDWFAKVNTKPDVQWMILINTSRAKDKKTRTLLLEKIKSDFSKFHSKLFELPDTSDHQAFTSFVQGIQQCIFAHLNLVVEIWDKSLRTMYEKRKQHNFDVFSYFTSMTQYGRNYWSFGAIEYAINIFDDVEGLLTEVVNRAQEPESPRWLSQLLNVPIENQPNLVKMFEIEALDRKEAHYLGMRNYLLCQQIIMAIHLYQHKMKSNDAAPSLRSDCAIEILRRTLLCIESVKEFNTQMNNQRDFHKTNCWILWTVSESLDVCNFFCDISHLDVAPAFLSKLHLAKFDAMFNLAKTNSLERDSLVSWLKQIINNNSLISSLQSSETMCQELEKMYELCIHNLSHRNRSSLHITYKYFEYLKSIKHKCPIPKLSINMNILKTFPKQESIANMLKSVYEENYNEDMLPILFYITQCSENDITSINLFLDICEKLEHSINWKIIDDSELFHITVDTFEAIQTKNSEFVLKIKINSKIGFDLHNSKIRLHFSSSSNSNIVQPNNLSTLSLQFDNKDNTCRLVSETKTNGHKNEENAEKVHNFVSESDVFILKSGQNEVITSTFLEQVGCFVLEKIEILSLKNFNLKYETIHAFSRRPPILYCMSTPHIINLANENNQQYLAGVIQKFEIEIEAKCDVPNESILKCIPPNPMFMFLHQNKNVWLNEIEIPIKSLKCHERTKVEVYFWLKIDSTICESAAIQKRTVCFLFLIVRKNR